MINRFLRWFSRTNFWVWFCKNYVAKMTFRLFGYCEFDISQYFEIKKMLREESRKENSVFAFTLCDHKCLAAYLIRTVSKCFWTHAGMLKLENGQVFVYHMKGKGIIKEHLLNVLKRTDSFAVLRYGTCETGLERYNIMLQEIMDNKVPYDYQQELDDHYLEKMYCSELVYVLVSDIVSSSRSPVVPHKEFAREVFEPDDVYNTGHILFSYKHGVDNE